MQEKLGLVSNQKKLERRIKRQLAREQKATKDLSEEQKKSFLDEVYGIKRDDNTPAVYIQELTSKISSSSPEQNKESTLVSSEKLTAKQKKTRELRIKKLQKGRDKIAAMIKEKPQESVSRSEPRMIIRPRDQKDNTQHNALFAEIRNRRKAQKPLSDEPLLPSGEEQGSAKILGEREAASQPEQSQQNLSGSAVLGSENLRFGILPPVGQNTPPPPPVPRETPPPPAPRPLPKLPQGSAELSETSNQEPQNTGSRED